MNKLVPEGK